MLGTRLMACTLMIPFGLVLHPLLGFTPAAASLLLPAGIALAIVSATAAVRAPLSGLGSRLRSAAARLRSLRGADLTGDRLDTFLDLGPQLAIETDAVGRIIFFGGSLKQRWRPGDPAEALRVHSILAPDSTDTFAVFASGVLVGSETAEIDVVLRPDSGPDIPARVVAKPVRSGVGPITGMRAVFTDISTEIEAEASHHRAMEQGLLAANRKLTETIEFLPDPTFVIDDDGRVTAWNLAMEELTGVPKEEMVGQGGYAHAVPFYGERIPVLIDHFSGDHLGESRQLYSHIESNKDTLYAESFIPFLNEGRGAYLAVTASPLFDSEGKIVGAIESLRDITFRKRAEEALRVSEERYRKLSEDLEERVEEGTREVRAANTALSRSEARYRRIVESLRDGHIFYTHDGRRNFTYISPSHTEVLGYESREQLFAEIVRAIGTPGNEEARDRFEKCRVGIKQPPYDLEVCHRDGSKRILEVIEVPVFGAGGEVASIEGLGRDVTAARRNLELVREAQEQLVESRKMGALGTLVAGLSHEINTPVGIGVTAASHLAVSTRECLSSYQEGGLTRSAFEDYLQSSAQTIDLMQSNLNRAADLLQNFKQVAADQSTGDARTFDLDDYLGDVLRSLGPRLKDTGFTLRHECESGLHLHCDPGALYQILSNLVMNSLSHGFEGLLVGAILLRARNRDGAVVLEYSDNGNGMSREQLTRLYEPFFTTKRGRGGTGLGMHIVYNNVTQVLGGTIACTSRRGRGTRFVITIPMRAEVAHG